MEARTHHGDEQLAEAARRLRDAVGLEARH
jgi:hypothetical protein